MLQIDLYSGLNVINALITTLIIIGCAVWLGRFAIAAWKYQNSTGMFLVALAIILMLNNTYSFAVQWSQAIYTGNEDVKIFLAAGRSLERISTLALIIGLFYLSGKHHEV